MLRRVFKRRRDGRFDVRLAADGRDLLRTLAPRVAEMVADEQSVESNPAVSRMFPVAYPEAQDADRQTEYRLLVHDELRASHLAALETLIAGAEATVIDAVELGSWMRAVNGIRLVLGTRLDITDDDIPDETGPPEGGDMRVIYDFLSWLTAEMVEALEPELDPAGSEETDAG